MSDTFGPLAVRPGILERSTHMIDFLVRNRPGTTGYRLWVSPSLEDAYGTLATSGLAGTGGTAVLETYAGGAGQTQSVTKRGWRVEESRRGQTSFRVDPEDVGISDEVFFFVRVQEQRAGIWMAVPALAPLNASYPIRGPILVVPTAAFHASSAGVITLQVLAPLGTGCVGGMNPFWDSTVQVPLPLHIVLPKPANTVIVKNGSAGEAALVSYGMGMPMRTLDAGESSIPTGGGYSQPGVREIVIASDGTAIAAVPIIIELSIGMELA